MPLLINRSIPIHIVQQPPIVEYKVAQIPDLVEDGGASNFFDNYGSQAYLVIKIVNNVAIFKKVPFYVQYKIVQVPQLGPDDTQTYLNNLGLSNWEMFQLHNGQGLFLLYTV